MYPRIVGLLCLIVVLGFQVGGLTLLDQVELCTPGSIAFEVQAAVGPYTVSWNPALYSGQNLTGLNAGTYQVTVTDLSGPYLFSWVINPSPVVAVAPASTWDPYSLGYYYDSANNDSSFVSNFSSIFEPVPGATYGGWWADGGGFFVGDRLHPSPDTTQAGVVLTDDVTGCATNYSLGYRFQNLLPEVETAAGGGFSVQFAGRVTTGAFLLDYINCLVTDLYRGNFYSCAASSYPVAYPMAPPSRYRMVYQTTGMLDFTVPLQVNLPAFSFDNRSLTVTTDGSGPFSYLWSGGPVAAADRRQPGFLNTIPTTYTLTVTDVTGASGSASIVIDAMSLSAAPVVLSVEAYCSGVPLQGALTGGVAPVSIYWTLSRPVAGVRIENERLYLDHQASWDGGLAIQGLAVDALGLAREVRLELPVSWEAQLWSWNSNCTQVQFCQASGGLCLVPTGPALANRTDVCGRLQLLPVSPCATNTSSPGEPISPGFNFSLDERVQVELTDPVTLQYQLAGLRVEVQTGQLRELNSQTEVVQACNLTVLNWSLTGNSSRLVSTAECPNGAGLEFVVDFFNSSGQVEYSYFIRRWPFLNRSHLLALDSSYSRLGSEVDKIPGLNSTLLLESVLEELVKVQLEFQGFSLNDGRVAPVKVQTRLVRSPNTDRVILETEVIFGFFEEELFYDPLFSLLLFRKGKAATIGLKVIVAFCVAAGVILSVVGVSYTPWGHKIILGEESWRVYQLRDHVSHKSYEDPDSPYIPPATAPADETEWV